MAVPSKTHSSVAVLFACSLVALAVGCSSYREPTTGPIAARPLAGEFRGESYTAKYARARIATIAGEDRANIEIFPVEFPCGTPGEWPMPVISATLPWSAGVTWEYSPADSATRIGFMTNDSPERVRGARAEILEAPLEPGATGKLRLRTRTGLDDEIEGEIDVHICE